MELRILKLTLILLLSTIHWSLSEEPSHLYESAFCQPSSHHNDRYFPISLPEHHLPWIWDAVYDPVASMVELTTMNRIPCRFNRQQWLEIAELYPEYLDQLAYGSISNILVSVDERITSDQESYLLGDIVTCEFMKNEKLIHAVESIRIRGRKPFTSFGTLQIRCPVPISSNRTYGKNWDRIRILLNSNRIEYTENVLGNRTIAVPICKLPKYTVEKKLFGLSICTATDQANREHLVEWIEYHLLVGVDRFYIYNTELENRTDLSQALQDYIDEGIVVVIPWHFMNCVRFMASGRWTSYRNRKGEKVHFKCPMAIAQQTAIASCYSRFRHTSKYMAHIDHDEFLVYSQSFLKTKFSMSAASSTLYHVIDRIFTMNPKNSAIAFEPIVFWPCNITKGLEHTPNNALEYSASSRPVNNRTYSPLPRLGIWDLSNPIPSGFECKLVMRTDAVGMFFVHYISMLELGSWAKKDPAISFPTTQLAMFHYRHRTATTRKALESQLPITPGSFQRECNDTKRTKNRGVLYHAQIAEHISVVLKQNFIRRMKYRVSRKL
jgi:hypothetical protein